MQQLQGLEVLSTDLIMLEVFFINHMHICHPAKAHIKNTRLDNPENIPTALRQGKINSKNKDIRKHNANTIGSNTHLSGKNENSQ